MRAFLVLAAAGLLCAAEPVKVESGLLAGVDENGLRVYRGIPYAAPPVGEWRWHAPRPAPAWQGVRAAEKYGPICMQAGTREMSEDCLTLNIWTAGKQSARLPVMVWIHGGAFRQGSGSMAIYDGGNLARQGVVVVTINYRLGDFGLFAHPAMSKAQEGEALGNYCLMDQIAALQWVQHNIAAFGGDARQVTIFGESAGGASVLLLMVSPEARGLFQRVIAESGGAPAVSRKLSDMEAAGERMAADAGVAGDADPVRALRAIPAAELTKRVDAARKQRNEHPQIGGYQPGNDGKILRGGTAAAFEAGKQAPVPLLLGSNSYEGSLMKAFETTSAQVLAVIGGDRREIERVYAAETKGDTDLLAAKLYGDALFGAPARRLAGAMETVQQPAWLYHVSYVFEKRRGSVPGTSHGAEIPLVFGNLQSLGTDSDTKMAERVSACWVRFAKTGNPNPAGRDEWPAYERKTDRLLEFGNDGATVRTHFRKEQLDLVEKQYRPR